MTDNLSYAWRSLPLSYIMPTSRLLDDLERAGYHTAGDVLDAKAETLAADVRGVGPIRAARMRQTVFDHAKRFSSSETPNWILHEGPIVREIHAPTPPLTDTLVTMLAMFTVALLFFVTVSILL
jgi:hypothetical protein